MKKVEALINPAKLEDVKAALLMIGITGLTTTELRVPDPAPVRTSRYSFALPIPGFIGQLKVEIVVPDFKASQVVEAVRRAARTGQPTDGHVIVSPLHEVLRIRTGEQGEDAI